MIIQERETEGDSSSAKYSVLPVCFFLFLSPPPLCPQPLPALHTGTLSILDVLIRYWRLAFSKERSQRAAYREISLRNYPQKGQRGVKDGVILMGRDGHLGHRKFAHQLS